MVLKRGPDFLFPTSSTRISLLTFTVTTPTRPPTPGLSAHTSLLLASREEESTAQDQFLDEGSTHSEPAHPPSEEMDWSCSKEFLDLPSICFPFHTPGLVVSFGRWVLSLEGGSSVTLCPVASCSSLQHFLISSYLPHLLISKLQLIPCSLASQYLGCIVPLTQRQIVYVECVTVQ